MKKIKLFILWSLCIGAYSCIGEAEPSKKTPPVKASFVVSPNIKEINLGDTIDLYMERNNIFVEDSINNIVREHNNGNLSMFVRFRREDTNDTEDGAISVSAEDCKILVVKGSADYTVNESPGFPKTIITLYAAFENKKYLMHIKLIPQRKGIFWFETDHVYFSAGKFTAYGDIDFKGNNLHHELLLNIPYMEEYLQYPPTARRIYAFSVK